MRTFAQEDRENAYNAKHGYCWINGCTKKAEEAHHLLENTKLNNEKYSLFIQSIFNLFPICHDHYDSEEIYKVRIVEGQARMYEDWLYKFKTDSDWQEKYGHMKCAE